MGKCKNLIFFFMGLLILLIAFVISRVPFFVYFPVVGFHPDSAVYFYAIQGIEHKVLPKFGVVPPLYPIFLYVIGIFSNKLITIVIIQVLLSFLSGAFLIYSISQVIPKATVFSALALSVFFMSSHSIAFDTLLVTESLYVSVLLIILGFFLLALFRNHIYHWVFFSLTLTLPILLRPTGFIAFAIFFFVILFLWFNRRESKVFLAFTLPFCIILFLVGVYSKITLNQFVPQRVQNYFLPKSKRASNYDIALKSYQGISSPRIKGSKKTTNTKPQGQDEKIEKKGRIYRFGVFLNSISYESRSFYYEELYRRYYDFYVYDFIGRESHGNSLTIAPFDTNFKKIMFRDYYAQLPDNNFISCCDIKSGNKNPLNSSFCFIIYDWIYKHLLLTIFRNKIFTAVAICSFILSLIVTVRSKFSNSIASFMLLLSGILFFTGLIMVFTDHNTGNWRYVYPTEFIYYLLSALIPFAFKWRDVMFITNIKNA